MPVPFNWWRKTIDINKVVVSNKLPFGRQDFMYFISCKSNKTIRTLCMFFPKVRAHRTDFDETEFMFFIIKVEKIFGNLGKR